MEHIVSTPPIKEDTHILDCFYTRDIEQLDPFSRQAFFEDIFTKLPSTPQPHKIVPEPKKPTFYFQKSSNTEAHSTNLVEESQLKESLRALYPPFVLAQKDNYYVGPSKIHKYGLFAKKPF